MKATRRIIVLLLLLWIAMTVFNMRLNVGQKLVEKGAPYPSTVSKEYGEINEGQASLVCSYFTGMRVVHSVYWYSSNNIMGKDSCPIWVIEK